MPYFPMGNNLKQLIQNLSSGETTWEESSLLDGLSVREQDNNKSVEVMKKELTDLYNKSVTILVSETDEKICQVLLPCVRRMYSGLSVNPIPSDVAYIFVDPECIYDMLKTKYVPLERSMRDTLVCTDTEAEAVALLCDDYIRYVKDLIHKDRDGVAKVINRELKLNDLLK